MTELPGVPGRNTRISCSRLVRAGNTGTCAARGFGSCSRRLRPRSSRALARSGVACTQSAVSTKFFSFYEKNSSLVYTSPNGKVATLNGAPAPGSQIEFTDLDYSGTLAHHSNAWSGSDHFLRAFAANGNPTCSGQLAVAGQGRSQRGPAARVRFRSRLSAARARSSAIAGR
jgi:hypothetical protein